MSAYRRVDGKRLALTPDQLNRLFAAYRNPDVTIRSMSSRFSMSSETIHKLCKENGIERRSAESGPAWGYGR